MTSTPPPPRAQDARGKKPAGFDAPFRWLQENPRTVDAIVFGLLAVLSLFFGILLFLGDSVGVIFTVPMFASGIFLRSHTGRATLVIGILATLHFVLGLPAVFGDVMIFYALYCANVHGSRLTARLAMVAAFIGCAMQAGAVTVESGYDDIQIAQVVFAFTALFIGGSSVLLAIWAIARYQRVRLQQLRMAREQADQALREREQRTALAVADERARIAREMHDVVAHSLSVIIAQADGGRFVASQQPEKAADVLETIGRTGRSALADMRGLLGVLRQEDETSYGPQPGLESLDELLDRVRTAGLPVTLERSGDLDSLPRPLAMTLFRVVQEALTNVMKHAGAGASAQVTLQRHPQELRLDVMDDGQGIDPGADGQGHGVTGMRERVALYGGTLHVGPLPAGGFRVSVRIPLNP